MQNTARFRVMLCKETYIVIIDLGPWDKHPTVTNDAEHVVASLRGKLLGRRLLYIDSYCELGELKVRDGRFAGFAPVDSLPSN